MSKNEENKEGPCEVCQKLSERKCSSCKIVYYCSAEHQKENWKIHKDVCKPYEIAHSKELGKYLIATRDLEPGDLIFIDTPLVFGPNPHIIDDTNFPCVGCCKLINEQNCSQCPECSWPCCNAQCNGLKSPLSHGFECQILKMRIPNEAKSFFEYFRFDALSILRALFLQKINKKKWETLLNLEDHLDKRGPGTEVFNTVLEKVRHIEENYIKPLKIYEQESGEVILPQVSNDIIHKIYGILDVNATELTEDFDATILYPSASLLEHNCIPNTCQTIDFQDNFKITFLAALAIKQGEHLTSTYTNILWGTQERRQHLKDSKYFSCTCERCKDPTELGTFLSALKCLGTEKEPCGGMQLPEKPIEENTNWICDKCHLKLPNKDVMKFVTHLSEEVDKQLAKRPKMEELEDFLNKLLTFLYPTHHLVYSVKHSLVQLFGSDDGVEISNAFLNEKLKLCEELIGITKKIDPGNARLSLYLGVLLNEQFLGKFKFLTRNFGSDNKENSLSMAKEILNILYENKNVLKNELQSSAGCKLFEVVCKNEEKFKTWMEQNNVRVEN